MRSSLPTAVLLIGGINRNPTLGGKGGKGVVLFAAAPD
jgi:hypothetical protein